MMYDLVASPMFDSADNETVRDRNTTVGQTVTFTCRTRARPPPTIRWYRNAVLLTGNALQHLINR